MECPGCSNAWNSEENIPRILQCGHTMCERCVINLFKGCQVQCQACEIPHIFSLDREFDDSDSAFISKCINTMSKNFTLLSLALSKSTNQVEIEEVEFQMCEEHSLPLHSYTEKPESNLCDRCIEEVKHLGLVIKPIPEVSNYFADTMQQISKNLAAQRLDCESILAYTKLEKSELEKAEKHIWDYFQQFKLSLEEIKQTFCQLLDQALSNQSQHTSATKKSLESQHSLIRDLEAEYKYFEDLDDKELVKWSESFTGLLEKSRVPPRPVEYYCITVQTNKALLSSLKEMLGSSYEISIGSKSEFWACTRCGLRNIDGAVVCKKCEGFRPLESYPNLLHSPERATEQEINELNTRRQIELQIISALDTNAKQEVYYLIHSNWINKWKDFIFNKAEGTDPARGSLPPGPISNDQLFVDSECKKLRPKLRAAIDYRGINNKVWEAYHSIYGGGPVIIRKKLNIYEESRKS